MSDEFSVLKVHEMGRQTITDCAEHASVVHTVWSQLAHVGVPDADKYATEAVQSWSRQVSALFTNTFANEQRVFRDGELSLYVTTNTIVFGVIFHPTHYRVPFATDGDFDLGIRTKRMGRYCRHDVTNAPRGVDRPCCHPLTEAGECPVHGEGVPAFALPVPGSWSFHS